jgi:hypothetical protein
MEGSSNGCNVSAKFSCGRGRHAGGVVNPDSRKAARVDRRLSISCEHNINYYILPRTFEAQILTSVDPIRPGEASVSGFWMGDTSGFAMANEVENVVIDAMMSVTAAGSCS